MKSLARTCTLWSVLYLVLAALVGAVIYERAPILQAAVIGGFVGGFFLWIALGFIAGMRTKGVEAHQLRQAIDGERPKDGQRVAVAGVVSGSMEYLESPITRKRCLAYEYKAMAPENQTLGVWEGLALAPMTIDGRGGSVRILAAPELDFPGQPVGSPQHLENFRRYIEQTTFFEHTNIDFKRDLKHLREVNTDDDGRIRDDLHGLDRNDVENMTLSEKTISAGEKVVAYGLFSSTRGGLVPDEKAMMRPVKIVKGEPEDLLRKVSRGGPADMLKGCGCPMIVLVAAIVGIIVLPLPAIEQMFPEKDPSWLEVRTEKNVRDLVTRAGLMPDTGTVAITFDPGMARGKVTMHGVTSQWERAQAVLQGQDVEVTLLGNAEPLKLRFGKDGTLLEIVFGNTVLPAADVVTEQIRIDENEILGRITYLTEKNDPSLRVAFRAGI
jgi:hypothetical protein